MSQQRIFPFRRVSVDHMVRGVTRVWWQLEHQFHETGPYVFQLQVGHTGLRDANDWQNVGAPVVNGFNAFDPAWREGGYDILTHYRIKLTTPTSVYVSQAANCMGELTERDWLISREVIRKEQLRHRLVSVAGYLLKQYRFGRPCTRCRDTLTQEVVDTNCPVCAGTSFEVGYHPPLAMQCWDLSPEIIEEHVDDTIKGSTRDNAYVSARVIGFPALNKTDVWINGSNDERWRVELIQVAAAIRGVPIVYTVKMGLIPMTNPIYAVEVGGEPNTRDPNALLPTIGCGSVTVTQDYTGADQLSYATDHVGTSDGTPIVGANVYIFKKTVFDVAGAATSRQLAVASTTTAANGRWTEAVKLDPDDYTILYEKPGEYGPDITVITVVSDGQPCLWLNAAPLGEGTEEEAVLLDTESGHELGVETPTQLCNDPDPTNDFWAI